MPISTLATISFPLDIPQVDVLATKQTRDGKFIITIESRREITQCGVCKREIACTYGHGQAVRLRHLPILGQETYLVIQPRPGLSGSYKFSIFGGAATGWPGYATQAELVSGLDIRPGKCFVLLSDKWSNDRGLGNHTRRRGFRRESFRPGWK